MLPITFLSLAALVSASPVDLYTDSLDKRKSARQLDNKTREKRKKNTHNSLGDVSVSDFNSFKFYVQHANAAYCNSEGAKAGDAVACGGRCNDVERNNATIIDNFRYA